MALPKDTQFYQASGADSGFTAADRRKFSYGQTGSPHELTNPIVHIVGGMVLSGTDAFAFTSGAVSPFTFDEYGRLKTDSQLVLSGGDVQIGAVELKGSTNDIRVDIQEDNITIVGSPAFMPIGGAYRSTIDSYTAGDAAINHYDQEGRLWATDQTIPPYTHSSARGNFTATYTSSSTLTLAGAPATITNASLVSIRVTPTAGTTSKLFINGKNGVSMSVSGGVVTIYGAGTPFASGDTYDVCLNLFRPAYDKDLNTTLTTSQNPIWAHYENEHPVDLTSGTAPSSVDLSLDTYQHVSMQIEMGSPAGSLWILGTNDTSASPTFQNWTGSIASMNGLGNTAGSVFLTTDDFLVMNDVSISTLRFVVSGAPTTTDIFTKRWY